MVKTPRPYTDIKIKNDKFVRVFPHDTETDELVWHRDKINRTFKVIEGTDWYIQFDNELPKELIKGKNYNIEKMVYHRIFKKGINDLVVEIIEK